MSVVIVNIAGVLLMLLVAWWFWLSKGQRKKIKDSNEITIVVDGGVYEPAHIEVPAGQPIVLRFYRKDPSPCAEKVIFSSLDISRDLDINKTEDIALQLSPGEYEFTCQMGMYRGTLLVR